MAFPPQFLEELRTRVMLSEVVGKRLRLIRAGREFKSPCPFHNEKTPSFYVNDQKGFFHCFGCGAHGDVVSFVMRHDNMAFPEAVERLAGEAGMVVPQSTPEERVRFERQKTLYDLVEAAARWFEQQLRAPAGHAALDYLLKRGLDGDAIARFRLGYAPADAAALRHHLLQGGFAEGDMVEAGLVRRRDEGAGTYSFFRNRVIFPVADKRGRIVAFGARLLEGDGPKYINTADTPLFHKGQLLYGLSRARQAAADGATLIVAEGYMDVIALARAGFQGAVAPLGTALTETQILELWKAAPPGARVPVLCFDGDNAGRRAAWRAVERVLPLLMPDHSVRIAYMPDGEDPDSLIRQGGARAMQTVMEQAVPLAAVVWEMETASRRTDTPEARAGLQAALEARVEQIADKTVQSFYRDEMRGRIREAFGWNKKRAPFVPQLRRPGGGDRYGRNARPGGPSSMELASAQFRTGRAKPGAGMRERLLMATLINHPQLFEEQGESFAQIPFAAGPLDELRHGVIEVLSRNSALDAAELYSHLCSAGFSSILDDLLGDPIVLAAKWARRDAPIEKARDGWRDAAARQGQSAFVRAELKQAEQALAREYNDVGFARMEGLRREVVRIDSGVLDDSDDDE